VPLASAPRVVFVHDGAPGFLARRVRSLGLPCSIDVCVPGPLVHNYLRQWRLVYPETRLCRSEDARSERLRRARSGDRSGVRLWCATEFWRCRDPNAVVVAEEMQDWPPDWGPSLLSEQARVLVVGCSGIGARLGAMLPRPTADARVYRVGGRRGAAKSIDSSGPGAPPDSDWYVFWIQVLAEGLVCAAQKARRVRVRVTAAEEQLALSWKALHSAYAYVNKRLWDLFCEHPHVDLLLLPRFVRKRRVRMRERILLDAMNTVERMRCWAVRAALVAYSAASPHNQEQVHAKAARLGAVFGDLSSVCSRCLWFGRHRECEWDPSKGNGIKEKLRLQLEEDGIDSIATYASQWTLPRTRFAQQVVLAAKAAQGPVPAETRAARAAVWRFLLRSWGALVHAIYELQGISGTTLDDVAGACAQFNGEQGGCLHLRGAAPMREEYDAWSYERRVVGAAVLGVGVGAMAPLPGDALAECLGLRMFTCHLARTDHLLVSVARPFLADFLAVRWRLVGGEEALMRFSFHSEITRVVVHPSFVLETDPSTLVQKLRFRWPHAQIVWHAADSTIAFALRDIFGP
jgi:hypothetical protein